MKTTERSRFYGEYNGDRDRCYFRGVVHAVQDSMSFQSRLWTWCELRLDWGDRAREDIQAGHREFAWTTMQQVTCFLCLASM